MLFTPQQVARLQNGVRGVLAFGIVTSMAANVLHAVTTNRADAPDWQIWSRSVLSALAPIVLFVCIELVSRIPIESRLLGGLRLFFTLAIGGFAGWVSYWHMQGVCVMLGETGSAAYLYPLMIDGMMGVGTISLIELGKLARRVTAVAQAKAAQAAAAAVAEEEAARTAAREARQISDDEAEARRQVGYDRLKPGVKAQFTKVYRTEGADAAIRQFGGRRRSKPQAPAAVKVADPLHPVSPGTVDTDRLNAGMAGATA